MNTLQELKDKLSMDVFGKTKEEATKSGLCIECNEPALENCYSEAGKKEYSISGLCEKCFDRICRTSEWKAADFYILENKMRPQKITNMRGFLCRTADRKMFFRQYNKDHSFRDFQIAHYGLEIRIVDSDAYAYQKGQTWTIDYGPT